GERVLARRGEDGPHEAGRVVVAGGAREEQRGETGLPERLDGRAGGVGGRRRRELRHDLLGAPRPLEHLRRRGGLAPRGGVLLGGQDVGGARERALAVERGAQRLVAEHAVGREGAARGLARLL